MNDQPQTDFLATGIERSLFSNSLSTLNHLYMGIAADGQILLGCWLVVTLVRVRRGGLLDRLVFWNYNIGQPRGLDTGHHA